MPSPESPADLPKRSWLTTLKNTLKEFSEDKLQHWAAALTYYAVLSLFPALLVMVSLVGLVADPQQVTKFLTDVISSLGPASAADTFKGPIESLTADRGAAGVMAIVGVASALWSASGYVGAFTEAANTVYEVEEGRPFWKKKPLQLFITFVCISLVALTAVALVVSGPLATAVGDALGLGGTAITLWQIAKWPVMLLVVLVILAFLYYAAPNARVKGIKWVSARLRRGARRPGSWPPSPSRSTWPTSAPTTRPTARSAAWSSSCCGCGSRTWPCCSASSSTPSSSARARCGGRPAAPRTSSSSGARPPEGGAAPQDRVARRSPRGRLF